MRSKLLILITVMTLLAAFLSIFHTDASARPQKPISQTGINLEATPVPTVLAIPVVTDESTAGTAGATTYENLQEFQPDYGIDLDFFTQSVVNGNSTQVVGVYVPGTLALPIHQQPLDNTNFVSTEPDVVTQFRAAERFQTVGLLAHNYLAGEQFYNMRQEQVVILIFGDGTQRYYQVQDIQKYQALSPTSPQSDFIDLSDPLSRRITAGDVFNRVYTQGDRVVFQTCIQNNGDPSWGRMFVIASPLETQPTSFLAPGKLSSGRVF
jgi:hypothetical protein